MMTLRTSANHDMTVEVCVYLKTQRFPCAAGLESVWASLGVLFDVFAGLLGALWRVQIDQKGMARRHNCVF